MVRLESLILTRNDFGSTKVNILDDAIVVEENVWGGISSDLQGR